LMTRARCHLAQRHEYEMAEPIATYNNVMCNLTVIPENRPS
jgi:hypothetical protein